MKKIITSSEIINKCFESVTGKAKFSRIQSTTPGSNLSNQVDSDELQDIRVADYKLKSKNKPDISLASGVSNFAFDPLVGNCTWNEIENNKEIFYFLTMVDMDFWMFGYTYQPYVNYPGIILTIKTGTSSKTGKMGTKHDPGNAKSYVYAPMFRANAATMYQGFSALANKAKVSGIKGIEFPNNWDEIPYTI